MCVWCLCIYILFHICVRDWFCRSDLKKYWYDYKKNFEINVHLFDRPEVTLCGWQDDKQDDALPRLLRETNSVLLEKIWNKNDKDTSLSCQQSSKRRHCHANSLPSDVTVMLTVFQATSLSCQQSSKRRHCHANSLPSDVTVMPTFFQATSLSCQQSSKRRHCHANSLPSDVIVMPTVFQALDIAQPPPPPPPPQKKKEEKKRRRRSVSGLAVHLIFHRFSPFNCCLRVVSWLDKENDPENSHVVFTALINSVILNLLRVRILPRLSTDLNGSVYYSLPAEVPNCDCDGQLSLKMDVAAHSVNSTGRDILAWVVVCRNA